MEKKQIDDKRIEVIMGNLLRYGVLLSAVVVFAGAIVYLLAHGNEVPEYKTFSGEPKRLTELRSIIATAFDGRGRSVIQLGLLLLISTPVLRIGFSIVGFIMEKDALYFFITLIVLTTIVLGSIG